MGNEFMITPIQKNKVYEDISTQIKKQIEDGTWKEGERIQGEIELAKEFQVGRSEAVGTPSAQECPLRHEQVWLKAPPTERARQA